MAFRIGAAGHEMWPECLRRKVAAITYEPLDETDLSQYPQYEPNHLWDKLKSAQKSSLGAVAYEMKKGDVIFVKQGPKIVGRGVVAGGYQFESSLSLRDPKDLAWPHQVPVDWERNFLHFALKLGGEQATVKKLTEENVRFLKDEMGKFFGPNWDKEYKADKE